jgi:hypothetical protein
VAFVLHRADPRPARRLLEFDEGDEVYGAVSDLADEIMDMPAHTVEGLAFKAAIALYEIDCSRSLAEAEERAAGHQLPDEYLISLTRDILALAGSVEARS